MRFRLGWAAIKEEGSWQGAELWGEEGPKAKRGEWSELLFKRRGDLALPPSSHPPTISLIRHGKD